MGRRGSQWRLRREHLTATIDQLMMLAAPPPAPPQSPNSQLVSNTDDAWQRHLQLRTLTDTISELETTGPPSAPPPARLDCVAQFTHWLSDNGVDLSGALRLCRQLLTQLYSVVLTHLTAQTHIRSILL